MGSAAFLQAHGITVAPDVFESLVREAVGRIMEVRNGKSLGSAEIKALEEGGFDPSPGDFGAEDPLARTAAEHVALIQTSLPLEAASDRLGIPVSELEARLEGSRPTLYGLRHEGAWRIPEFELIGDQLLPGLEDVVGGLDPGLHPVVVFRWFSSPNPDLVARETSDEPLTPRDWLQNSFPTNIVAKLAETL